jgi:TRAP-type transport system periplasmic protein
VERSRTRLTKTAGLAIAGMLLFTACAPGATPTPAPATPGTTPGAATPAPTVDTSETASIRLLTAFAAGSVFNGPVNLLVEEIQRRTDGRLTISVDGPDVVPFTEGIQATANGVYDIHYNVPLFHTGVVPAGEAIYFISPESTCAEYREAGALDIYDQAHREAGVFFLGCGGGGAHGATFLTKQPINDLADFDGMRFRGFGLYTRVLDVLGASSVAMPPPDIYSAIERGVVDGAAYPNLGIVEQSLHEVTPYIIMPPYLPFRYGFYMNPDSFDNMPPGLRDLLQQTVWDLEDEFNAYWVERRDAEAEQLRDLGMTEVELPQEQSDRLRDIIYTELWGFIEENSPRYGRDLREAFEDVESR